MSTSSAFASSRRGFLRSLVARSAILPGLVSELLALILCLVPGIADATIVSSKLIRCPLCGEQYATSVVVTWNYNLSNGAGPPTPEDCCPYCLYSWRGEPGKLPADAKVRVREVLARFGEGVSPAVRARLAQSLSDPRSSDESLLRDHLRSLCDAAVLGKPLPVLRKLPKPKPWTGGSAEDRRDFLRILPAMLAELRKGRLVTLPKGSGDREMGALYSSADGIREGDPRAAEFFIRWVTSADSDLIRVKAHAVTRNFTALAAMPVGSWPTPPPEQARVPLMAECLRYIGSPKPDATQMRKKLAASKWDDFSNIVTACCAARRDRAVAGAVLDRIRESGSWRIVDSAALYFASVGTSADIPALTKFAHRLYRTNTDDSRSWEAGQRGDIEGAIRTIRLRAALAVHSPDSTQPPK